MKSRSRSRHNSAANTKNSVKPKRKRRGRPVPGEGAVGREVLIEVTRKLLTTTPPVKITRLMVAKAADVDPALIRYYFGTVDSLIAEVAVENHRRIIKRMTNLMQQEQPLDLLRARLGNMIDLFIENPHHHDLINEVAYKWWEDKEDQNESVEVLENSIRESMRYTASNVDLGVKQAVFRPVDPRLLHIAMIGVAQIFGGNPGMIRFMFDKKETVQGLRDRYVDFVVHMFSKGLQPDEQADLPSATE